MNAEFFAWLLLGLLALALLLRRQRSSHGWLEPVAGSRWLRVGSCIVFVAALAALAAVAAPPSRHALAAWGMEPIFIGLLAGLVAAFSVTIAWRELFHRSTGTSASAHAFFRAHPGQVALLAVLAFAFLVTPPVTPLAIGTAPPGTDVPWQHTVFAVLAGLLAMGRALAIGVLLATALPAARWLLSHSRAMRMPR